MSVGPPAAPAALPTPPPIRMNGQSVPGGAAPDGSWPADLLTGSSAFAVLAVLLAAALVSALVAVAVGGALRARRAEAKQGPGPRGTAAPHPAHTPGAARAARAALRPAPLRPIRLTPARPGPAAVGSTSRVSAGAAAARSRSAGRRGYTAAGAHSWAWVTRPVQSAPRLRARFASDMIPLVSQAVGRTAEVASARVASV